MNKIKAFFRILFTPLCWIRSDSTNKFLSARINSAIDNNCDVILRNDGFYVIMDDMLIWIKNYPYGYGSVPGQRGMPDRTTVFRLADYIDYKLSMKKQ